MNAQITVRSGSSGTRRLRVAIFDDAFADKFVRATTERNLTAAGYEVLGLFAEPHPFDEFLRRRAEGELDIVGTIHTYPYDGQQLSVLHEPNRPALGDRYLRTLFPISAPVIVRCMNVGLRVAVAGTAAREDPLVAVMDAFDAVWGEGKNPSGPFTFFHADQFQLAGLRWYRGGDRPRLITGSQAGVERLRRLKASLKSIGPVGEAIDLAYFHLPEWVLKRWGGDLTEFDAYDAHSGDPLGRVMKRQTSVVKDWVKILNTLQQVPEVDTRRAFYDARYERDGMLPKVLVGDDNPDHLREINLRGLERYDVRVCHTAAEIVRKILRNDEMRREDPALMYRYIMIDMEMPARMVRGEIRPRNRRDRIKTPHFYPIGLVIAACARKLGYRVGVLTFGEHHGSPVMSLLGNGGTLRNYELVGARGIMVVSAQIWCRVPGGVRLFYRNKLGVRRRIYCRMEPVAPADMSPSELTLQSAHPRDPVVRLYDAETNKLRGFALTSEARELKWWGGLAEKLDDAHDPDVVTASTLE